MTDKTPICFALGVAVGQALKAAWLHQQGWMITFTVATAILLFVIMAMGDRR